MSHESRASRWRVLICLLLTSASAASPSGFPSDDAATALGLQAPADGSLELRVWSGGGIGHPFQLVRIRRTDDGVDGERIAWSPSAGDRPLRRFMKRHHCSGKLAESGRYLWCEVRSTETDWAAVLNAIDVEGLWALPSSVPLSQRSCLIEDGTIVTVDLLSGGRSHRVSVDNPGECCDAPACAILDELYRTLP